MALVSGLGRCLCHCGSSGPFVSTREPYHVLEGVALYPHMGRETDWRPELNVSIAGEEGERICTTLSLAVKMHSDCWQGLKP